MPANLENSAVATGLEKINFHSNPKKKGNAQEYHTIALISHASKVMLKILQARLQQYMNHELLDVQAGFRKGRETRDQVTLEICKIIVYRISSVLSTISPDFACVWTLEFINLLFCYLLSPWSSAWALSSVQFSRSVMSDSLRPHESQHARPPCPSPTPGVHSNSRPLSWWSYPSISSSVVPFSTCPQSLPASESFQWVNSSHEVAKVLEFQL